MKIIKLSVLGLLFVGSFNVLGVNCEAKNKHLTYKITSSIYSYSNDTKTGTCKCKAGYEFSGNPPVSTGEGNLFIEPFGLELKCVIPKDDTKPFVPKDDTKPSVAEWVIPISVLSLMAIGGLPFYTHAFVKVRSSFARTYNIDTVEMLDRHLLPENQIQRVENNIYSETDGSRTTHFNENTSINPNDENIYATIDEVNGEATGGPMDSPSITTDAWARTGSPAPEEEFDEISSNASGDPCIN